MCGGGGLSVRTSELDKDVDSWSGCPAAQAFVEIHNTENPSYAGGIQLATSLVQTGRARTVFLTVSLWLRGHLKRSTSDLFQNARIEVKIIRANAPRELEDTGV